MPRVFISYIYLEIRRAGSPQDCEPLIENANTFLRTKMLGKEEVTVTAHPPADPVADMIADDWQPIDAPPGHPHSTGDGPYGFQKQGEFESIWIDYVVPIECKCKKTRESSTRRLALSVRYERGSLRKPGFFLDLTDEKGEWQNMTPIKTERGKSTTYAWDFSLPCPGCGERARCNFHAEINVRSEIQ